jgi:cytochrome c-type biogenesis protein CcmH
VNARYVVFVILALMAAFPAFAQETVSDDDVNTIAERLYCPVCENIPLDVCGTQACSDWRAEIRTQLEEGQTAQQIIDNFVARYGERVIGTPQDPTLRALSLVTPWVVGLLALVVAGLTFLRWRSKQMTLVSENTPKVALTDEEYRARVERDLLERR